MSIPVTYEDLQHAYNQLVYSLDKAFDQQKLVSTLEAEKADLWAELQTMPDFKPGRSNLEQDAKLRTYYPDFMVKYERALQQLEGDKHAVELDRLTIAKYKALIDLAEILSEAKGA